MASRIEYLVGETVGNLKFVRDVKSINGVRKAVFECSCGNNITTVIAAAKNLSTKSCGCTSYINRGSHKQSRTKEYKLWSAMKDRCYNKANKYYPIYGEIGITVQDGWMNSPEKYIEYIKALEGYGTEGYSIDRIENTIGYIEGNLRWASKHTQSANKSKKKNGSSIYKGVSFKSNGWVARITIDRKEIYLGRYKTEAEAAVVYNEYIHRHNLVEYPINKVA